MIPDWACQERERFRSLFTSSLHTLVEDCIQKGQYSQASAYARQWVQADPLDEAAWRDLLFLLELPDYLSGTPGQL